MAKTVTVNEDLFRRLMSRAELYRGSPDGFDLDNVYISRAEYDILRQSHSEYWNLRNALINGGIDLGVLETLIRGNTEQQPRKDSAFAAGGSPGAVSDKLHQHDSENVSSSVSLSNMFDGDEETNSSPAQPTNRPNNEKRTLLISGLSSRITYKHLTDVIRGGRILYMMLRYDRTAILFMAEGAADFLAHVKRHDLYVQQKRLEVEWSHHQFHVAPYVGRKLASGVTRNLVIRNGARFVDSGELREHMEHIHQFFIIDMTISGRDVYIYTNSVHNALFARTCMMSRKQYKGLKIEFFQDECAGDLPSVPRRFTSPTDLAPKAKGSMGNLFEALSVNSSDGSDEENRPPGRDDDDDDTIDGTDSECGATTNTSI